MVLSPDLWTSVEEVSLHATAMTLFVPVRPLAAGAIQVTGQSTVVAVLIGTFNDHMAWGATKEAGRQLFGLGAVLGEMPGLVAVSTLDVLAGIVSVRQPLDRYPGTFVFVIDLSLLVPVRDQPAALFSFSICVATVRPSLQVE